MPWNPLENHLIKQMYTPSSCPKTPCVFPLHVLPTPDLWATLVSPCPSDGQLLGGLHRALPSLWPSLSPPGSGQPITAGQEWPIPPYLGAPSSPPPFMGVSHTLKLHQVKCTLFLARWQCSWARGQGRCREAHGQLRVPSDTWSPGNPWPGTAVCKDQTQASN